MSILTDYNEKRLAEAKQLLEDVRAEADLTKMAKLFDFIWEPYCWWNQGSHEWIIIHDYKAEPVGAKTLRTVEAVLASDPYTQSPLRTVIMPAQLGTTPLELLGLYRQACALALRLWLREPDNGRFSTQYLYANADYVTTPDTVDRLGHYGLMLIDVNATREVLEHALREVEKKRLLEWAEEMLAGKLSNTPENVDHFFKVAKAGGFSPKGLELNAVNLKQGCQRQANVASVHRLLASDVVDVLQLDALFSLTELSWDDFELDRGELLQRQRDHVLASAKETLEWLLSTYLRDDSDARTMGAQIVTLGKYLDQAEQLGISEAELGYCEVDLGLIQASLAKAHTALK